MNEKLSNNIDNKFLIFQLHHKPAVGELVVQPGVPAPGLSGPALAPLPPASAVSPG